jgi:uncharacterized lipoprotein YmbA
MLGRDMPSALSTKALVAVQCAAAAAAATIMTLPMVMDSTAKEIACAVTLQAVSVSNELLEHGLVIY